MATGGARGGVGPLVLAALASAALSCLTRPDLAPGPAASLGRICAITSDCPWGYSCNHVVGVGSQTDGFCTIPCTVGDATSCGDGFPGPGVPTCATTSCVILCGTPDAPGQCPDPLVCAAGQGENVCVRP